MAVTIEEYATGSVASGDNYNPAQITIPAGTVAGDILFTLVGCSSARTITTPAGWSVLGPYTVPLLRCYIFTRTAEAGDAEDVISFTPVSKYSQISGVMLRISGGNIDDITIGTSYTYNESDYTPTCPSITVPNDSSLLLRTVLSERDSVFTGPAGYVEEVDTKFTINDYAQAIYSKTVDAGATGTVDITASPTWHDEFFVTTISIGPAEIPFVIKPLRHIILPF